MRNFFKLFAVLDKWKPYYLLSAFLLILSTVVRMLEPKVLQIAIDGVILFFKDGNFEYEDTDWFALQLYKLMPEMVESNLFWILFTLAAMYIGIALIRGLSRFASSTIASFCTEKSIKRLRDNLFGHIQRLPLDFHGRNTTGELIQRCTGDVDTIKMFINNQVVDVILLSTIFISSFVMMASIHLVYALIAVASVPIIIGTAFFFFKREKDVWEKHEAEQDKLTSIVEENLAGIRVVKAFAKEEFEKSKFKKQNTNKFEIGIKHVMLHAKFWTFSDGLVYFQIAASMFFGGYFALQGAITIGELSAFYTYSIMVTMPMRRLAQVVSQMGMAMVAFERLSTILESETEDYGENENKDNPLVGEVEFKNVYFKYPKVETEEENKLRLKNESENSASSEEETEIPYTLENVSFKVKAGSVVALLGPTGAGKSTVINLLCRFYEPESGTILLDGKDLKSYSKPFLRKRLGVVLQKPFLFSTTIGNNIAYTAPKASEAEIKGAASSAAIDEIMHLFENGYDTLVGEKGVTLSGGQKQRVALARTLLEKPDILILDDSTSAVDTETEHQIQEALQVHMKDKTSFIVAHRVSAIQNADQILVLDSGSLIESGTHSELMNENGFYKQVYDVQAAVEADF